MRLFYNAALSLYYLVALLISPWNRKARLWIGGRRGWKKGLKNALGDGPVIWFHCASLGEFEQGRPLIEAARERFPEYRILLTFFSPSGYEKRRDYPGADYVMYLPLDSRRNAAFFLDKLRIEMAVFIKYEFWFYFLKGLQKRKIPTYLASGIFRSGQVFFKWYGSWYRSFLRCFTHIFVQDEDSELLLAGIGLKSTSVVGDTRFDRVLKVAKTSYENPALEAFAHGRQLIVAGSTWEPDEEILAPVFTGLPQDLLWIIAPHELSEAHIQRICSRFSPAVRLSQLETDVPGDTRSLVVDSIGQLSYLYRFGQLAYIGGGFGRGIHNVIEAAVYGMPVIFGPNHERFREARELLACGGGFAISDTATLLSTIHQQLTNPHLLKTSSGAARIYVKNRAGASTLILDEMCKNPGVV